jgi:hypothetical protein
MGVTTWLLNETLRELEREGLISVLPRKGIFVSARAPVETRFVQIIYLDPPDASATREYGLTAFVAVAAESGMECRVRRLPAEDLAALKEALKQDCVPESAGAVICGTVTNRAADVLAGLTRPWVLFGDGRSRLPLDHLPVVCGDNFQGGQLAAAHLLERHCEHLILVNLTALPDWPWVSEARAGILSAAQGRPGVEVLLPESDALDQPREFLDEVRAWAERSPKARVGIICRGRNALHAATPIPCLVRSDHPPTIVLMNIEDTCPAIPGVRQVFCSMRDLAATALRRLSAARRGIDTRGRIRVPYTLMPAAPGRAPTPPAPTETPRP